MFFCFFRKKKKEYVGVTWFRPLPPLPSLPLLTNYFKIERQVTDPWLEPANWPQVADKGKFFRNTALVV